MNEPTSQTRQPSLFSSEYTSGLGSVSTDTSLKGNPISTLRAPVAQWPLAERPAWKLRSKGRSALSNAELLSLIIPSGARTEEGEFLTRIDLARHILEEMGSLEGVFTADPGELEVFPGIGPATAAALCSAGALTCRLEAEQAGKERLQICRPEDAARAFGPEMRDLNYEILKVLALNTANVVTEAKTLHKGGLAASIVEPRAIFKFAISRCAASVLILHNHPSQNLEPSREDVKITKQIARCGEDLGIPLRDHLIIGGRGYTSLAERGIL